MMSLIQRACNRSNIQRRIAGAPAVRQGTVGCGRGPQGLCRGSRRLQGQPATRSLKATSGGTSPQRKRTHYKYAFPWASRRGTLIVANGAYAGQLMACPAGDWQDAGGCDRNLHFASRICAGIRRRVRSDRTGRYGRWPGMTATASSRTRQGSHLLSGNSCPT